jgi:phospholipid/cholesterol/gamma-HCH transport system substrate-binding protein
LEAKTNYAVVGLAVLILLGGLIAAGLWLSVGFDQKQYHLYAVYIDEAVSGLSEESPVKYNGVKVGFVKKITLNRRNPQQVKILLNIEEGTPVTTSTTATLISQGITGTTYVGLSANSSDLTPLETLPNELYPIIPAKPSLLNQLDKAFKDVSENVNKVSLEIGRIFDRENAKYIKKTLMNLEAFSDVIVNNSKHIDQSIENADIFIKNVANVSHQLPDIVKELKAGVHKLDAMTTAMTIASNKVSAAMDVGKTTINKISQQALPPTVVLLRRFDAIAANLEKVSSQMRQNPAIVIRGTTPSRPGPGE